MGTFCTTTVFYDFLIGVTENTATNALLSKKIEQSENTIKSRLSKKYNVTSFATSTAIPPQLTTLCEQLTEGYYWKSNSRGNESSLKRGQSMCKMALDELKLILDGDVGLLDSTGSIIPEKESGVWDMTSSTIDYSTTFDEDDPTKWRVDPDKLTDISDNRL